MHTFSPADLPAQFVLSTTPAHAPTGWNTYSLRGWTLAVESRLPVVSFADGWILGFPVDPTHPRGNAAATMARCETFAAVEALLDRLSGRFAVVALSEKRHRVYLDASGALAAVYSPTQRLVASTPTLVPLDDSVRDDPDMIDAMNVRGSPAFFAFGTTPRRNVFRLLPNHYLDLDRFDTVRHWPREKQAVQQHAALVTIAVLARGVVEAICAEHRPYLSLTAGRDSRMLLALSKDLCTRIRFVTWAIPGAEADLHVARRLAKRYGLRHEIVRYRPPRPRDLDEWLFRSGGSVGEPRGMDFSRSFKQMDAKAPFLPGLASEVGRAYYWQAGDENERALTGAELVVRLHLPAFQPLIEAADKWLDGLPLRHRCDVLDIAYIEQRLGCWASVEAYTHDAVHRVSPFSNRTIFESMMALPFEYRRAERMADDIIGTHWPELLDLPFNPEYEPLVARVKRLLSRAL